MTYTPRRCSSRWLDGDCPAGVLAIMDHPRAGVDRYTIFYAHVETAVYGSNRPEHWLTYLASDADGRTYHGEMMAADVAAYRYAQKHHYIRWSDLPDAVQRAVRADLDAANAERAAVNA